MKKVLGIIISIGIVAFGILHVHAQSATIDLSLSTVPLDPQPQQQITISAQSYSTDLSQADLVWTYNGKTIASDVGETHVTVIAPASGATGTITVTASGGSFTSTSATILLRPASVDLLWEGADSYTPPFYKGRALPSTGGLIRVVAIPATTAPRGLSYNWSQNDSALQSQSGYAKSSIVFQNNALIPTEHIDVTEQSGEYSGDSSVDITPGNPSVVGYLNTNGFIDYSNGSNTTLNTTDPGAIVHFEPYNFSLSNSIGKDLAFSYTDNSGNSLANGGVKNELRLSSPDGGGAAQFNIAISTIVYSLQNLSQAFSVNFN